MFAGMPPCPVGFRELAVIVRNLSLHSFRRSREEKIGFSTRLNVFAGVNGPGKSTILHAVSILLSWYAKRIVSPQANGSGMVLPQSMIRHGDGYASVAMEAENFGEVFHVSGDLSLKRA